MTKSLLSQKKRQLEEKFLEHTRWLGLIIEIHWLKNYAFVEYRSISKDNLKTKKTYFTSFIVNETFTDYTRTSTSSPTIEESFIHAVAYQKDINTKAHIYFFNGIK